jgi:phage terminase small subunit
MSMNSNNGGAKNLPALPDEDESALGPAMLKLNRRQREFVRGVVSGLSQTEAVSRAGYEGTREVQAITGVRLGHHPGVQAAILEEGIKVVRSEGPKAIAVLSSIASNAEARDRDRITAAVALLDRGGFGASTSHRVDVHHHEPSREEVRARLAAACDELGFTAEMKARALKVNAIELDQQPDGSFAVTEAAANQQEQASEQN